MIDSGLPLALATDFNPGSTPSGNMNFVVATACIKMKMTPEEAINAATINGAYAMGLSESHGSITKGKLASLIITKDIPSYHFIPYAFGTNVIDKSHDNRCVYLDLKTSMMSGSSKKFISNHVDPSLDPSNTRNSFRRHTGWVQTLLKN